MSMNLFDIFINNFSKYTTKLVKDLRIIGKKIRYKLSVAELPEVLPSFKYFAETIFQALKGRQLLNMFHNIQHINI